MRIISTADLSPRELGTLKRMLEDAYNEPFVEDWDHALGGTHFLIEEDGEPVSHASVVERSLVAGGKTLRTGYVEAVATRPDRQSRGLASSVMDAASELVRASFELGGLSTGRIGFYERFGWERWRGPTFVRSETGRLRTAEEDGAVMILRTPTTPALDLGDQLSCDWRRGDVW